MPFDLKRWQTRIQQAETYQAQYHGRWSRNRKLYNMDYWRELGYQPETPDTLTPVNYATTFVSTLVAAIFARNPKIFLKAHGGNAKYERFAAKMEDVLEIQDDEFASKEVALEILIDAILCNIGWVEEGYIPPDASTLRPETGEGLEQRSLMGQIKDFLRGKETPGVSEPHPPLVQEGVLHERLEAGEFYEIRRSPYDVLWPMGFHRYVELPYLILHERVLAEDFLANPAYQHKDLALTVYPQHPEAGRVRKMVGPRYDDTTYTPSSKVNDQSVVHLYTVWDRRDQSVFTLSKGARLPHIAPHDWPHFAEGFPFIPLQLNLVPETPDDASPYGFSDIEPILPQILEKSGIRTESVKLRKRASVYVFVQKGSTTETELSNQATAEGLAIIPVSNIDALKPSAPVVLPPVFNEVESRVDSDLDRESGLPLIIGDSKRLASFQRASIATMAQGNTNLKQGYKVDRLEAFFKAKAKYRIGLNWQYMTRIQVGELLGGEMPSEEDWPSLPKNLVVARQRVRRAIELKIQPGSTRPIQDDVLDREQFLRATSIFQAVSPDLFKKVERDWMAALARKFRDPVIENLIKAATDSTETEHAQAENQLLLQGHPQVVQGDDQSHLAVHAQAVQDPRVQQMLHTHAAQGQVHPLDQHIMGHAQSLQAKQAGGKQSSTQKGAHQQAAAPSGAETTRMGTPTHMDVQGQAMNLRAGAGPTKVGGL